MSVEEPKSRRTVREFMQWLGITRAEFRIAREKAGVRPNAYDSVLSVADQRKLLGYVSRGRRNDPRLHSRPSPPPAPTRPIKPPPPELDYEVEIERMEKSLTGWRGTLIELTKEHLADVGSGKCARCHEAAPCRVKRTMTALDLELVQEIALGGTDSISTGHATLEQRLRGLYRARDRWREVLVKYAVDHMIEDEDGKCHVCRTDAPCDVKQLLTRLNKGIARQIENRYAVMDDEQLAAAFNEPIYRTRYAQ